MVHEELAFVRSRTGDANIENVEISEKDFASKARQLEIYHLKHFYESRAFALQNYRYDAARKVIIQSFAV